MPRQIAISKLLPKKFMSAVNQANRALNSTYATDAVAFVYGGLKEDTVVAALVANGATVSGEPGSRVWSYRSGRKKVVSEAPVPSDKRPHEFFLLLKDTIWRVGSVTKASADSFRVQLVVYQFYPTLEARLAVRAQIISALMSRHGAQVLSYFIDNPASSLLFATLVSDI